jgi:hypothetical protein
VEQLAASYTSTGNPIAYAPTLVGSTDLIDANGAVDGQGSVWAAELGRATTPGHLAAIASTSATYEIAHQIGPSATPPSGSFYGSALGQVVDGAGTLTSSPNSASAMWPVNSTAPAKHDVELFSGSQFTNNTPNVPPSIVSTVHAQFDINFGGCT